MDSKPAEEYIAGDSGLLKEENDNIILKSDAIQQGEPTPLRKRWLEAQENFKTSLNETHAVSDTKNAHQSITIDDIKELLVAVKGKLSEKTNIKS